MEKSQLIANQIKNSLPPLKQDYHYYTIYLEAYEENSSGVKFSVYTYIVSDDNRSTHSVSQDFIFVHTSLGAFSLDEATTNIVNQVTSSSIDVFR